MGDYTTLLVFAKFIKEVENPSSPVNLASNPLTKEEIKSFFTKDSLGLHNSRRPVTYVERLLGFSDKPSAAFEEKLKKAGLTRDSLDSFIKSTGVKKDGKYELDENKYDAIANLDGNSGISPADLMGASQGDISIFGWVNTGTHTNKIPPPASSLQEIRLISFIDQNIDDKTRRTSLDGTISPWQFYAFKTWFLNEDTKRIETFKKDQQFSEWFIKQNRKQIIESLGGEETVKNLIAYFNPEINPLWKSDFKGDKTLNILDKDFQLHEPPKINPIGSFAENIVYTPQTKAPVNLNEESCSRVIQFIENNIYFDNSPFQLLDKEKKKVDYSISFVELSKFAKNYKQGLFKTQYFYELMESQYFTNPQEIESFLGMFAPDNKVNNKDKTIDEKKFSAIAGYTGESDTLSTKDFAIYFENTRAKESLKAGLKQPQRIGATKEQVIKLINYIGTSINNGYPQWKKDNVTITKVQIEAFIGLYTKTLYGEYGMAWTNGALGPGHAFLSKETNIIPNGMKEIPKEFIKEMGEEIINNILTFITANNKTLYKNGDFLSIKAIQEYPEDQWKV
jgi:hypothetical protein